MTRIPSDCLSRECIAERIKRRQTATIVYQYRSAYRDAVIAYYIRRYRLLTIAESFRSSLTSTIVESAQRFRSRFAARFSSALLESRLVFVMSARARARISLNSISFYRRSASEILAGSSFDRPTPTCVRLCIYPPRRLYISCRVYPRRCGLRQDVSTLVEAGHVGARAAIVAGALTLRGCNEQDDLSKPLSFLRRYLAFRVTRKESRTINLSSGTGMSFGQRKTHTCHDESL